MTRLFANIRVHVPPILSYKKLDKQELHGWELECSICGFHNLAKEK
jgi:hypothetical protein